MQLQISFLFASWDENLYNMEKGTKECMLYLPMFNCVTKLEIGISESATIEAIPSPFKYKIMVVGSSITHGASASRPGGAYVARMGRALNAETPNIGLSGRCKLDDYFANIVCGSKADAYIFDTFSNSTAKQIDERLYNFVKRITEAHPGKPMIFLQTIKRDIGHFNLGSRKRNDDQREAAVKGMERICKEFKHVYFINDDEELMCVNGKKGGKPKTIEGDDVASRLIISNDDYVYYYCEDTLCATKGKSKGKAVLDEAECATLSGYVYILDEDAMYSARGKSKPKKILEND